MGTNCFETPLVMGYRRVPEPPAKIIPFKTNSLFFYKVHNINI